MPNTKEKLADVHSKLMGLLQRAPYIRCEDVHRQYAVNWLMNNGVTVQEWISVKDRLPENDYGTHWKERPHYLVCLANGLMMVATFGFKEYAWWIDSHSCVLSKEHYKEVTHWMPLPQPPKGE